MSKCKFDKKDGCHALGCFSKQKCSSRDKKGNPVYWLSKKQLKQALESEVAKE